MASLVIDAGVTALVHDRLRLLADALGRKRSLVGYSGAVLDVNGIVDPNQLVPVQVGTFELQVAELARRALAIFEDGPRGPIAPGAPHTGTGRSGGTSKLAFLGSAASSIPRFTDVRKQSHEWLVQVLRRGSPAPAESSVVGAAIDATFATAERAIALAGDAPAAAAARAFAMGMLCGVASDVVVGPLLRGADSQAQPIWRDAALPEIDPSVIARVEAGVRANVFGGASSNQFLDYWPSASEFGPAVRGGFAAALAAAAEPFHGADPANLLLSADAIGDSYKLLRASESTWSGWEWLFFLLFYSVPVGLILPIAAAPDSAKWKAGRLFRPEGAGDAGPGEEGWSQIASLSLSLSTIGPAVTTFWLWGTGVPGMETPFWLGTAALAVDAIGAVLLAVSTNDGAWSAAARWVPIVAQAVMRAIFLVLAIVEPSGPVSNYYWIQTIPLWTTIAAMLMTWLADATTGDPSSAGTYRTIWLIAWPVLTIVAQIIAAVTLSGGSLVSRLLGSGWNRLPDLGALAATDPPYALARVFDESTLWSMRPANATQSVADLRYPPGAQPMLDVWWTGAAGLQISHAGRNLSLRIGDAGAPQALAIPPGAKTPAELAAWLEANAAPGGVAGQFHARPKLPGDTPPIAHRLPWPEVVEDIGLGTTWKPVGDAAHPYTLNHAARRQLAAAHGQRGPAVALGEGWPIAPGAGRAGADGTGVGMAAELGMLLALGGASRFHDPAAVPVGVLAPPPIARVSQVFRRWNLDERRANEWRMLVGGGASSEKPSRPVVAPPATETVPPDDALPASAATSPAVLAGSEDLTNQLGWLPLFRAWTRVAADVEQDAMSERAASYNPVIRRNGRWVQPTNRQLTEAMRYLLDQ